MSNPYDPPQQDAQQWGQSPYPNQPGQGYAEQVPPPPPAQGQWAHEPQGGQQWSGGQEWQPQSAPPPPAQPAQIDWSSGAPQPAQAPWQGPAAFAPPAPQQPAPPATHPGQDQPWVAAGTAQTAQEVAGQWQAAQPPAPGAEYQPPAPEPQAYQPPAPEQFHAPAPEPYQPPAAPQPQQWPSYNAPAQSPTPPSSGAPINEAATVTTPAVADPAPPAEEEPEALTIGRGRGNSIVLDDMLVSRQHVRITADTDGLVLEDLGSRNGTYVNGRRVERTHLSEGDRIGIGAATFEVRDGWLLNV